MSIRVKVNGKLWAIRDRIVHKIFAEDFETAYTEGYEQGADDALNGRIPFALTRGVSIGEGKRAHVIHTFDDDLYNNGSCQMLA